MFNYNYYSQRLQSKLVCLSKEVYSFFCPYKKEKKTILIVGAQRSGTNLLMDVFERSFLTDVYHERDKRAFIDYQMRPLRDINILRERSGYEFFVLKGLCEAHKTVELINNLAPAKAIWVIRDFNDVVNSMDISFKETKSIIKEIAKDKTAGGWRTGNISDATYNIVNSLVHDKLSNKSASALQWYIRNIIYFEKELFKRNDIKVLNYNCLVVNPKDVLNHVFQFTGVSSNILMNNMINVESIRKNKTPEIDDDIRQLCSTLWQRFNSLPDSAKI